VTLLENGRCEGVKAGVHGVALGLALVCGVYNFAALVQRRQGRHLAVNALLYAGLAVWEFQHLRHHLHSGQHEVRTD
jgi:hypothetical protein